jgi:hypothetical protein
MNENHQSKRYKLYPKCSKHKDMHLRVCNNCLVALLNIDACPFGCVEEQKNQKVKADKQVKIFETGFLLLYPLPVDKTCYLELFVFKLIEERGRMDRWEAKITRISPTSNADIEFQSKFPLYYSAVGVSKRQFLVCGGVVGSHISNMIPTNQAFVVSITPNLKEYTIIPIEPMNKSRAGHTLVYHPQKQLVFSIGGFTG